MVNRAFQPMYKQAAPMGQQVQIVPVEQVEMVPVQQIEMVPVLEVVPVQQVVTVHQKVCTSSTKIIL